MLCSAANPLTISVMQLQKVDMHLSLSLSFADNAITQQCRT